VIIVLAAAIILTLNNNNPIENAKEATFKSDIKTLQEELSMYIAKQTVDSLGDKSKFNLEELNLNETSTPKVEEVLTGLKGSNLQGKIEVQNGKLVFTGTDEKEINWFNELMGQTEETPPETVTPGVPVLDDTLYTTTNSDGGKDTAIIPEGFKVSTVETEQKIETGLVVIAPDNSEFVWVPVQDINIYIDKSNERSKLWEWTKDGDVSGTELTYLEEGNREPDYLNDSDYGDNNVECLDTINNILNLPTDTQGKLTTGIDFKTMIQNEWEVIYTSIEKNGGFYIGRYETGNLSQDKVVSMKGNTDIHSQNWYTMYAKQKKYSSYLNGTSINSSMIYGFEWDATMKWFSKSKDETVRKYPVTSNESIDNYNGTGAIATGSLLSINNIYDMAGNVYDWTVEANANNVRVGRGYFYGSPSSRWHAGFRFNRSPIDSNPYYGTRMALYL
jgi:hypothetical protein